MNAMDDNQQQPVPSTPQEQLARIGMKIDVMAQLAALELPEPAYGEVTLGTLTEDEAAIFVELFEVNKEMEARNREGMGGMLERMGKAIKNGADPSKDARPDVFATEAEAHDFFLVERKRTMLHSKLHWMLGEHFGMHHWAMGVRQGGRVVKTHNGRRY